eukprot:s181_g2.t1
MCCIFRGRRSTLEVFIVIFRGRHSTLDVSSCVVFANRIVRAASRIPLPPKRTTVGNVVWIAKLLTTEDGHVVGWSFSHEDAAPTVASSTPSASSVAPPAAGVVVSAARGHMPAAAASVGGASGGKDMHAPDCHMSTEACAPRAGGDVRAQQAIGAAAVDPVQLMARLRSFDVEEKKRVAEATRASLVKVWKEKAQLDKGGKDYRGIIDYDCMGDVPKLMEASDGEQR